MTTFLWILLGGVLMSALAVGGAFIVDMRLGVSTWLAAAAHEVPQELGDFGVLVPEVNRDHGLPENAYHTAAFVGGLVLLYVLRVALGG